MSEELTLPCPACENTNVFLRVDTRAYVFCTACGMCGPCTPKVDVEYAVRQWNALPRALTWTDEPPKVPGWYWCRTGTWSHCVVLFQDGEQQKVSGIQWAGPIPEPREPK